jgi:H+-transporting ATPase
VRCADAKFSISPTFIKPIWRAGKNSFMGTSANLMASVHHQGRLHKILLQITIVLLVLCILLCAAIFARLMTAEEPVGALHDGAGGSKFMRSLSVVVVILVASIPVAIEVVVTSTMAVGSHAMSRNKVIVARLSAIEELAGMTILCSDKTGTLTLNQLDLREPILVNARDKHEALLYSALASKREGNMDAIDKVISEVRKSLPYDSCCLCG